MTDFKWNTSFIFNRNRNKAEGTGALQLITTNAGAPVALIDGEPVGVFYGTFFARNADGSLLTDAAGIPQLERGFKIPAPLIHRKEEPMVCQQELPCVR